MESLNSGQAYKILLERLADKKEQIRKSEFEFCTVSKDRFLRITLLELEAEIEEFKEKHPEVLI